MEGQRHIILAFQPGRVLRNTKNNKPEGNKKQASQENLNSAISRLFRNEQFSHNTVQHAHKALAKEMNSYSCWIAL